MAIISDLAKTNQEVIPQVSGDVFSGNPESRFALGVFDGPDVIAEDRSPLIQAYLQLRANVYIDQIGVLESNHRRKDGTEIDENDERSTHIVLFENLVDEVDRVAVFGCMRLIEKSKQHPAPLPIEEFYPESFNKPAPDRSIEVSRFIMRHDEQRQRTRAKVTLIRAGLAHTMSNNLGPVYATVEPELNRDLRLVGVPTTQISLPKYIEEYNTTNYGIEIGTRSLAKQIGKEALGELVIPKGNFGGYWGQVVSKDEVARIA